MSMRNGDKSRYNRERRKRIARRAEMRILRATMGAKGAPKVDSKAPPATKP